jgi:cell division protein ZipA
MDKELLRIVIITAGAIVILGMVLWSVFKKKNTRRDIDFYDKGNPLENIDSSLILNTDNDDFDIVPLGSALDGEYQPDPITVASEDGFEAESEPEYEPEPEVQPQQTESIDLPSIIQFSIVASADEGFNGKKMADVFKRVGLEYGSMKVFERLDDQRRVDYAVASMVEPGTFPDTDLESFNSPGIVFFLQPGELDNPLEIFDDYIQTINWLATELDGVMWDHNRQPLTNETIREFRVKLSS